MNKPNFQTMSYNEEVCYQALKILLSRKYPYNLCAQEMETIFKNKLKLRQ